ncbi:MAG: prolipoprotein diacylglyceryl transferase [Candidatus Woesearchaeota archaeon]
MILHNINPDIFVLGPFHVRFYGVVYAFGFLIAYLLLSYYSKKKLIKNFEENNVDIYILWLMFGSIIFARLFEVIFYEPIYYFGNPIKIFFIWEGGLSFHGGLMGAVIVTYLFCKKKKINFYEIADLLVIPFAMILGFGRMANFINGELWGTKSNLPWCVDYSQNQYMYNPPEGCRHPSQIYESFYSFVIFFVLLWLHTKNKLNKVFPKGFIFWMFVMLYGIFRFIENFWREDARYFGISIGQYMCFVMIIVSAIFLWKMFKKKIKIKNKN